MSQVRVRKSKIHGYGLFAERDLKCGEVIIYKPRFEKRRVRGKFYELPVRFGGYNHSCAPNTVLARMYKHGLDIVAVVYRKIPKGKELTVDYDSLDVKCNCELHKEYRRK